jgi:RNA-directed DNA polymerase
MTARVGRFLRAIYEYCRRHRHDSVEDQHAALVRRIRGHFNYYGVNGNTAVLGAEIERIKRTWLKWLCRRSQRARLNWVRYSDMLRDFPIPRVKVFVDLWARSP